MIRGAQPLAVNGVWEAEGVGFAGFGERIFSISCASATEVSFSHTQSQSGGSWHVFLSLQPSRRLFLEPRPGYRDQPWAMGLCPC